MVSHEHVSLQLLVVVLQRFLQPIQITLVVFNDQEASFAVVAPLGDVKRNVIEWDARATGHAVLIAQNNRR